MAAVGGQFTEFYGRFLFVQWVYSLAPDAPPPKLTHAHWSNPRGDSRGRTRWPVHACSWPDVRTCDVSTSSLRVTRIPKNKKRSI